MCRQMEECGLMTRKKKKNTDYLYTAISGVDFRHKVTKSNLSPHIIGVYVESLLISLWIFHVYYYVSIYHVIIIVMCISIKNIQNALTTLNHTAYDTVNHRLLIQKLYNTTLASQLCRVIQNLLSDRTFYVELNNERNRWRIQKNGLPQGSVLSPTLFNI